MRSGLFVFSVVVVIANVAAFFNAPAMQIRHSSKGKLIS